MALGEERRLSGSSDGFREGTTASGKERRTAVDATLGDAIHVRCWESPGLSSCSRPSSCSRAALAPAAMQGRRASRSGCCKASGSGGKRQRCRGASGCGVEALRTAREGAAGRAGEAMVTRALAAATCALGLRQARLGAAGAVSAAHLSKRSGTGIDKTNLSKKKRPLPSSGTSRGPGGSGVLATAAAAVITSCSLTVYPISFLQEFLIGEDHTYTKLTQFGVMNLRTKKRFIRNGLGRVVTAQQVLCCPQ